MNIKKFQGNNMIEVLEKIRREMGKDAVILHTRTFYQRDKWRFWRKRQVVEITASNDVRIVDVPLSNQRGRRKTILPKNPYLSDNGNQLRGFQEKGQSVYMNTEDDSLIHRNSISSRGWSVPIELQKLQREIEEIKRMTTQLVKAQGVEYYDGILGRIYEELLAYGVDKDVVDEILEDGKLQDCESKVLIERLKDKLADYIGTCCGIGGGKSLYKIVLIGPTGVGKTTTIAKLAAKFSLLKGKKVGLLTIDTFRIAAVDQLKTYAEIMRLPIEVVVSPQDVPLALRRLGECDYVFVDTAGRSQKNNMQMSELRTFLSALQSDEVHLVLSATSSVGVLGDVVKRFSEMNPTHIIFTKLDESQSLASLVNIRKWSKLPFSYLTTGQSVPDDIEEANSFALAKQISEAVCYAGSGTKVA